jgi:hypothetical protein
MCEKGQTHDRRLDSGCAAFRGKVCAHWQESLLRISSPATGDVVVEGQPLRITIAADASVRVVGVLAGNPLPEARLVGRNQLERLIPKNRSPQRSVLTAVGRASIDVESSPASIHVQREDSAIELQVQPPLPGFAELGDKFPLRVYARFADGSNLDVTHSGKVTFTRKIPRLSESMTGEWPWRLVRGNSSVMVSPLLVLLLPLPSVCGSNHGILSTSSLAPDPAQRRSLRYSRLVL